MLCGKRAFKIMLAGFAVVLFSACSSDHTEQDVIRGDEQNGSVTQDTTPPVITLNGEENITLNQGEAYIEPGATALDKRDGNVDVEISSSVDTSKVGSYTVTYRATDSAGNKAQATRTVSVTVSTLQLQSLNLEINVSTLNLGEQASLSVTGNYKDNTVKDLTEQVVWIISPSGSVEINGTVLTTFKDTNVTLQAKVGTIVSNTVNLNIYWEVNGHRLPPEPDPAVNNSTLLGIDSNNNDVRDDVERKIYSTFNEEVKRQYYMQEARHLQAMLADPELIQNAKEWQQKNNYILGCRSFLRRNHKVILQIENIQFVEEATLTTKDRLRKYLKYDRELSGGVYSVTNELRVKSSCNFDIDIAVEVDK